MRLTGEFLTPFTHHFNILLCLQRDLFIQFSEATGRHFSSLFSSHQHKSWSRDFGKLAGISFSAVCRIAVACPSCVCQGQKGASLLLYTWWPAAKQWSPFISPTGKYIYLIRCIHTWDGIKFHFISEIMLSRILEAPVHFAGTTTQQKWPKEKLFFCHQGIVSCSVLIPFTSLDN